MAKLGNFRPKGSLDKPAEMSEANRQEEEIQSVTMAMSTGARPKTTNQKTRTRSTSGGRSPRRKPEPMAFENKAFDSDTDDSETKFRE